MNVVALALSLAIPSATALAQQLTPGTRVRVKSSEVVAPIIGSYQGMRRDTLVVIEDGTAGQLWSFAPSTVDQLEVTAGMKGGNRGPITKWTLIGAPAGAFAGWLVAVILEGTSDNEYDEVLSAVIGAGVGAAAGAAYGYRFKEEHWTAVPLPGRVGLVPSRNGVRLTFRAGF
jgi:hypothetical protein